MITTQNNSLFSDLHTYLLDSKFNISQSLLSDTKNNIDYQGYFASVSFKTTYQENNVDIIDTNTLEPLSTSNSISITVSEFLGDLLIIIRFSLEALNQYGEHVSEVRTIPMSIQNSDDLMVVMTEIHDLIIAA